ncbi:MAG: hypothetical protein ACRD0U_17520, partial [Acidimicrobiales bacterium]
MAGRDRRDPQHRMQRLVLAAGVGDWDIEGVAQLDIEPWWLEHLAEAERSIRRLRGQLEALSQDSPRTCEQCGTPIGGRADRRYCSDLC